jgi:hypothetical protein
MVRNGWSWLVLVSGLSATLVGIFAPVGVYERGADALIALLSILMAAVLPAMILAGTSLRAGRFSAQRVRSLADALDKQILAFGGLFAIALSAAILIIVGKISQWPELTVTIPYAKAVHKLRLGALLPAAITFLLALLTLRSFLVITGVRSIQRLTAQIAEDEAVDRERAQQEADAQALRTYRDPDGYGSFIRRPH